MDGFEDKTVLVTGAAGGIGGTIARRLVAAGADVVASARKAADLEALVAETGCRTAPCDLTSEEEVREALEGLELDGVVSCAGFGGEIATPMETDMAVFDKVMAANARSVMLVTKHASRGMVARGRGGAIVNVSSQAALVALDNHVSYAASKAAVDSITRVSALELGRYGIRVNGVHPTVVMTEMSEFYWGRPEVGGPFLEQMPLGRWATEDEIAGPVLFLLSDAASMVTGIALPIDGGYSCR